jgi:hypothetical protein
MDADINRDFNTVFDAHDAAIRALREANVALATVSQALATAGQAQVAAMQAQVAAMQAHDAAIQKAVDATHGALSLFRRLSSEDDRS